MTSSIAGSKSLQWMPPIQGAHIFGVVFIASGIAAMIFNSTILIVLYRLRRSIFSHIFYILIFNFSLIDLLKSICSIVWALKLLPGGVSSSIYFMKADQLALMILRFSNLATILNLLMITLNEFIYIVYPFRHRQIITSVRVVLLIAICWIVACGFTLSILLIGSRKQSIYIKSECLIKQKYFNRDSSSGTVSTTSNVSHSVRLPPTCFVRSGQASSDTEFVYNIFIIIFCFVCLVISVACYTALIRFITKIVKADELLAMNSDCQIIEKNNGELNRTRKQLLRRNKYVIVIGSVLAVYTVYLISYSSIKFLFVSRLKSSQLGISRTAMYYVRWGFQTMLCLHSLLQPLCYFRMREFRYAFKNVICHRNHNSAFATENIFLSTSGNRRRSAIALLSSNKKNNRL